MSLVFFVFCARAILSKRHREKRQIQLEKRQIQLEKRQIQLEKRQIQLEKRQKNYLTKRSYSDKFNWKSDIKII